MTTEYDSWADHISSLSSDPTFLNELAQIKARALLKELSAETVEQPKWSYLLTRVLRNMTAAIFELEVLAQVGRYSQEKMGWATRQFALAWEGLAKLSEGSAKDSALVNAVVSYELAGYQANAACLARSIGRNLVEIDQLEVSDLASAYLQRLFLQVMHLAKTARRQPSGDSLTSSRLWKTTGLGLVGEAFAQASQFFLQGNRNSLEVARKIFQDSESFLSKVGAVHETNIVRAVRSLLTQMQENSTWSILENVVPGSPRWRRYLKLLARGLGPNIIKSQSVSELWPSQLQALRSGLLSSTSSKVIKMPTSAGKTRVAELAMVHTLITVVGSKCVYIAPYRALVSELEQTFLNLLGDLGYRVSSVTGSFESDDFEDILVEDADVLVMTPEKLDLLQRARPEFLENVRLFIMDEAQIADDFSRGVKFELLLTRLKRRLANARFLFLSAVVPHETLEDFATWLKALPPDRIITSEWRPSIQRVAKFVWKGSAGVLKYTKTEDNPLLEEFVPGVIKQRVYSQRNPKDRRQKARVFPDFTPTQTAAELAYKFADLGPVLVFCTQTNFAKAVATSLEARLELGRSTDDPVPNHFHLDATRRSAVSAKEWLGKDHIVTRLLTYGVAIHYGNLPEAVRKAVETDFRERNLRVIISTNTLAQGVNLPIRTVIVHSCRRHSPEGWVRMPARDYWNIAGRAGRAGRETDGTIIHIVADVQADNDYAYYLSKRDNVEPLYSRLFQLLLELIRNRMTTGALQEKLDPEILALLVEEGENFFDSHEIGGILSETLTGAQAVHFGIPMNPLENAFLETAKGITDRISDPSLLPVYSSTGLSTTSCEAVRKFVLENKDTASELLTNADVGDVDKLISFFLSACLPLVEMQPDKGYAGNYGELMQKWLSGASITDLTAEFGIQAGSTEQLAKFLENFFGFRLPWGITSTTKIATNVLGLQDEDICIYTRFFPSMTKYGVPNPVSTWAMAAGIPFREAGMKVAAMYLGEVKRPDYKGFLEWLSNVSSDRLKHDFQLKSPVLEDVSAAISRSSINPLLREHSSIVEILPHETYVRGITYENRANVALASAEGQSIELLRDYDNPFDHNAITVRVGGHVLGFLERNLAQLVAPDIDCGLQLNGAIVSIKKEGTPEVLVRLTTQDSLQARGPA